MSGSESTRCSPDKDSASALASFDHLRAAWERFVTTGEVDPCVRPVVAESWRRCRSRGLDPWDSSCFVTVSVSELATRLEQNRELIATAWPLMVAFYELVKGSGFRVDLTDGEGYLLKVLGDPDAIHHTRGLNFREGANRAEERVGTNGIGVVLATGLPVQIVGPEHYNVHIHHVTCAAAPIKGAEGRIIGVLNMAGRRELVHKHTLGVVAGIAGAIERQLKLQAYTDELRRLNRFLETVTETTSDGLIAFDPTGRITHVNSVAAKLLRLKDASSLVGRNAWQALGLFPALCQIVQAAIGGECEDHDRDVVLHTGQGAVRCLVGVRTMDWGAEDAQESRGYLAVISRMERVRKLVHRMVGARARFTFADIVGDSPALTHAIELARAAANSEAKVLLFGESGCGKELFAQAIHNASSRRDGPFLAVNCSAVPGELIESELFGYEGGAFTGAKREGNPGKFELAEGGTLFLDEVDSMPLEMQAKLLRVIEDGCLVRVGGSQIIRTDVRIISASNRDLRAEVARGSFREDLFYRLNVVTVSIPPLRDRPSDIPLLVEHFLKRLSATTRQLRVDETAMRTLCAYRFPGNVRELQNILERAAVVCRDGVISQETLPDEVRLSGAPGRRQARTGKSPASVRVSPKRDQTGMGTWSSRLAQAERELMLEALEASRWNMSRAALELGVGRSTLYRKLRRYGLSEPGGRRHT